MILEQARAADERQVAVDGRMPIETAVEHRVAVAGPVGRFGSLDDADMVGVIVSMAARWCPAGRSAQAAANQSARPDSSTSGAGSDSIEAA